MVSVDEVLSAVRNQTRDKPVTTAPELADHLPISRRTVLNRLNELEARGDVESYQFGERTIVWWPDDIQLGSVPSAMPNTHDEEDIGVLEETEVESLDDLEES